MSINTITGTKDCHAMAAEAEIKLDLKGLDKTEALNLLDMTLKDCAKTATPTLYVYFNPVKPGEGETLFQPIGQRLKLAKQDKIVDHCTPVMNDHSGGFLVVFKI